MKINALILLVFILVVDNISTAQESILWMQKFIKDISTSGLNLSGKVEKVVEQEYDIENGSEEYLEIRAILVYMFDDRGLNVEDHNYFADGRLNYKNKHRYDKNRNQVEIESFKHHDSLGEKYVWTYDDLGNMIALDLFFEGELEKRWIWRRDIDGNVLAYIVEVTNPEVSGYHDEENIYAYDEKGKKIEEIKYVYGNLVGKDEFTYNENGDLAEKHSRSSNGTLHWKELFDYGDSGNLTRKIRYEYLHGGLDCTFTYIYDTKGNLIEESQSDNCGKMVWGYKEKRDSNENVIELQSYAYGGGLLSKTSIEYDTMGNVTEILLFDSEGLLERTTTYSYVYDQKGNWIKKTEYSNAVPDSLTIREIEYYD